MVKLTSFVFILYVVLEIRGRNFTRCELAYELKKYGFPQHQLRDWVCLVEAESSRKTDAIGGPDDDGSYDYGLFQINDRYWCSTDDIPGKGCKVRCEDLITDDITAAVECTKIIYKQQGFEAWVGWMNECNNRKLPDISTCLQHIY